MFSYCTVSDCMFILYNLYNCHKLYCLMIIQFWIWIWIKKKTNKQTNKNEMCDTIYFVHIISFLHVQCFFSVKCQNSASDLIQCYCAKCVFLLAYECLQKYICIYCTYYYIPFLNDQSFHHWQKLCKSNWRGKSVSTSNMCQPSSSSSNYMCTTATYYCLTLNGRTMCIKAHSIDNNTIYVYIYIIN